MSGVRQDTDTLRAELEIAANVIERDNPHTHAAAIRFLRRSARSWLVAAAETTETCEHEWVDARNEVVLSGEVCVKCYAIRAAAETTPDERVKACETCGHSEKLHDYAGCFCRIDAGGHVCQCVAFTSASPVVEDASTDKQSQEATASQSPVVAFCQRCGHAETLHDANGCFCRISTKGLICRCNRFTTATDDPPGSSPEVAPSVGASERLAAWVDEADSPYRILPGFKDDVRALLGLVETLTKERDGWQNVVRFAHRALDDHGVPPTGKEWDTLGSRINRALGAAEAAADRLRRELSAVVAEWDMHGGAMHEAVVARARQVPAEEGREQ